MFPQRREPEPPRLEALKDVNIVAAAGLEDELRFFYEEILGLPEDPSADSGRDRLYFWGKDYRLVVETIEAPRRPDMRRRAVLAVMSLADVEELLQEHDVDYVKETGLWLSERRLHVTDPAGNRLEIRQTWPF